MHRWALAFGRSRLAYPLLLIGVVACETDSAGREPANSGQAQDQVQFDTLVSEVVVSSPSFGAIQHLLLRGDTLWVADALGEPYVHVINLSSRALVRSFGRRGEGPGDLRSVRQLSRHPGGGAETWAYDWSGGRMVSLPVKAEGESKTIMLEQARVSNVAWLDDSTLIGVAVSDSARYVYFDAAGRVRERAAGQLPGADSVAIEARLSAGSQVRLCVHPDGLRFAVLYAGIGRVEITAGDGSATRLADVPYPTDGDFQFDDTQGRWKWPFRRYHYRGCATTSAEVYGLYSGRIDSDTIGVASEPTSGQEIHVFDWSGRLHRILHLGTAVSGIEVTVDGRLFAVSSELGQVLLFGFPASNRDTSGVQE